MGDPKHWHAFPGYAQRPEEGLSGADIMVDENSEGMHYMVVVLRKDVDDRLRAMESKVDEILSIVGNQK